MIFSHRKIDASSKMFAILAQHWVESVNATMVLDFQRTWGYKDPKTGQVTGMAGRLQRHEADIGGKN